MTISRCFIDILAADPRATAQFYTDFLGFRSTFSSDWFVNLAAPEAPTLEIGILLADQEIVPASARSSGRSVGTSMLTVVVSDIDALHEKAKAVGVKIVEPPRDLFYGQRRMVLRDPAGTLVDVSSECEPDPDWLARVKQAGEGSYYEE